MQYVPIFQMIILQNFLREASLYSTFPEGYILVMVIIVRV